MVGFRKAMDYCPSLFSQRDLFYLDRWSMHPTELHLEAQKLTYLIECYLSNFFHASLMPEKKKKNKSRRIGIGSDEVG